MWKNKTQKILFIILMIPLTIHFIYINKKYKEENEMIRAEGKCAIGIVDKWFGTLSRRSQSIDFHFFVKKRRYDIYHSTGKGIPGDEVPKGSKFLVLYLKDAPETCLMLYDEPVRDSADYFLYLEELRLKRGEE